MWCSDLMLTEYFGPVFSKIEKQGLNDTPKSIFQITTKVLLKYFLRTTSLTLIFHIHQQRIPCSLA